MAVLQTPATLTDDQIIAAEAKRGQLDFTGPQGHADALTMMGNFWNRDSYGYMYYMGYLKNFVDKVG